MNLIEIEQLLIAKLKSCSVDTEKTSSRMERTTMIILFVLTMYLVAVVAADVRNSDKQKGKQKNKKNFIYHYTGVK